MFEPIAIIGRACLLPAANTPEILWQNVLAGKDCLADATFDQWDLDPDTILNNTVDGTWSKRCGYVQGFADLFDPTGFLLSVDIINRSDVLQQWLLHAGRQALNDAGIALPEAQATRGGIIMGNLSYPTKSFVQYAESVWLNNQAPALQHVHADNRFMSGLPIFRMAEGLGLNKVAYAIDAACASSVYAIKLACDQLQSNKTDLMIAGGVNAADSLFLQMGFSALRALSKTGRSLPLHREADGLVPSQGVALVVLKRLKDAIQNNNPIHGVIKGIGLSNDGRGSGLLVPHSSGQVAAMEQAYQVSGLSPEQVSWVECHATGTPLGDSTEIRSMQQVFKTQKNLTLGILKANIGHSITASGAAALINILSAFKYNIKPMARLSAAAPASMLQGTGFQLGTGSTPWEKTNKPRLAAINCFGFGGNNAHMLVEEWQASCFDHYTFSLPAQPSLSLSAIAIIATGVLAANATNKQEWIDSVWGTRTALMDNNGHMEQIDLAIEHAPFPPRDLHHTLGQQLAIVKASQEALAEVKIDSPARTAVFIGMQCDAEIARSGLRWRLPYLLPTIKDAAQLQSLRDHIQAPVEAADIIGCMPNIIANRINNIFDFKAPSFSVSAEELSGVVALELAVQQLQNKEIDMAIVGAVDMNCEPVHQRAAMTVLKNYQQKSGDAAVVLVLKRLADAKKAGDRIESVLSLKNTSTSTCSVELNNKMSFITDRLGHSHAACGLLHVAAANLGCAYGPSSAMQVNISALGNKTSSIFIQKNLTPKLVVYSGNSKEDVLHALRHNRPSVEGRAKLVLVAHGPHELHSQKNIAEVHLTTGAELSAPGIFYSPSPLEGQLAFVFTGALTSYANMGLELVQAWPELIEQLQEEAKSFHGTTEQIYQMQGNASLNMLEELKTYSFLAQVHARFSSQVLKIKPQACIGYCAGETNALIAMGAWRDMEQLFFEVEQTGLYNKKLAGDYKVLEEKGAEPKWSAWRVFSPVETVKKYIESSAGVRLTIINSLEDCIIAGHPKACEQFLKELNSPRAKELPHSLVIHCPEFAPYAEQWRQLHYRPTYPVDGTAFYSAGSGTRYQPTADNAADALVSQAANTVDFPRVIRQAWDDGVRLFVEHGPRDICSQWISEILTNKPHVTISFDKMGVNSLTQSVYAIAKLLAAGAVHFDYSPFLLREGVW